MRESGVLSDATSPDEQERQRIAALEQSGVLDSSPEQGYDDIVELAAFICGTPISLVSFVDTDRQWFKAEVGLGHRETPRTQSFCSHTLGTSETLIVRDARDDARFRDNPLVLGEPRIRFYAGAPVIEKNGHVLGTVCVIDTEPRELSAQQISALEALARQVVVLLEQRETIEILERSDRQLQESERRLLAFANGLPALAWIAKADGWIYWYNRRWYDYTGTTPQQMEGWGWQSVHDPATLPSVLERWAVCIRTGEPFEMVFPLKGADGEFRPFLTRIEPLRDDAGQIVQWFGTNTEVDALRNAQLALEKSEEGLHQVLTATTDAVVSVNREWVVTYVNPKAEELYGASAQLVGRNLWEALPHTVFAGSPFVEHYTRAMQDGIAGSFEAEFSQPMNVIVGVEAYPSKDGIVTFSRDITQLKHATAAALRNEKLAAVGRLASSIAHEVNNPLEAVTNLLYLADLSEDLEKARPYLRAADLELRRASAITQQTLRFHRQSTRPTRVTFAELISGILVGQRSRLSNADVQVRERNRAILPVFCLEGEIRQVLANLISNAIDAMHGRSGSVLYLRGRNGRDWKTGRTGMVLTIADTGTGMAEQIRVRVFEAFYTTKGIGGTGLGLWISREIVDRHQGVLRLRTRQGLRSGTVFRVFLPQNGVDAASMG